MDPFQPTKIEQSPLAIQRLQEEDLQILEYRQIPGGILGRFTEVKVAHKELGERTMVFPMPMTPEATLQWIALTVPPRLYRQGDFDASFADTPQEKPAPQWEGDPLRDLTPEGKQAFIQEIRAKAAATEENPS